MSASTSASFIHLLPSYTHFLHTPDSFIYLPLSYTHSIMDKLTDFLSSSVSDFHDTMKRFDDNIISDSFNSHDLNINEENNKEDSNEKGNSDHFFSSDAFMQLLSLLTNKCYFILEDLI